MIVALGIKGLRGIREGQVDGLRPLTMFVGPNGCGKSTVLEAVGVACAGGNAERAFNALAGRDWLGIDGMKYWCDAKDGATITARFDPDRPDLEAYVRVSTVRTPASPKAGLVTRARGEGENGRLVAFSLQGWEEGVRNGRRPLGSDALVNDDGAAWSDSAEAFTPFASLETFADRRAGGRRRLESPRFSSALRDAISAIKLTPWYDDFIRYLRDMRPGLDSIESIAVGDRDEPFLFEREPRRGYPIAYAGDGFRRALLLAATLAQAKGGVAALDEPEAFAHPTMGGVLARLFERALGDGTQILVSTHSLEFVSTVIDTLKDHAEKTAVVGLSLNAGVLHPLVVMGAEAYRRIVKHRDDLRM